MKAIVSLMLVVLFGAVFLGNTMKALSVSESDLQDLRQQLGNAQSALGNSQANLQQVTQTLAATEAERDELRQAYGALQTLTAGLQGNIDALQTENTALREQVQALSEQLSTAQTTTVTVPSPSGPSPEVAPNPYRPYLGAAIVPVAVIGFVAARYGGRMLKRGLGSKPKACVSAPRPVAMPDETISVRMSLQQVREYARWRQKEESARG